MASAEQRKKLAAEQYLAENRVRWLLENVTADLIRFAPTQPHEFIVDRINKLQEHGAVAMHRHRLVAILGGPASGKGMSCANVAQELGTVTVAPPELLRNEVRDGTAIGKRVGELLHANAVVPKEFLTELMNKKLEGYKGDPADEPTYVLDGFPRSLEQGLHFETHGTEISRVIYLQVPDEELVKRMEVRTAEGSSQDEATPDARKAKLLEFRRVTHPVIEYYKALGKLSVVDASQPSARVMAEVEALVRK